MAISPIMGLSAYSSVSNVQPMNYAVSNESEVSDVFANESMQQAGGVKGASPVLYPNATVKEDKVSKVADPFERQKKNLQVSSDYNDIAAQFTSNNTSYSKIGTGSSYSTAGSRIDIYA